MYIASKKRKENVEGNVYLQLIFSTCKPLVMPIIFIIIYILGAE